METIFPIIDPRNGMALKHNIQVLDYSSNRDYGRCPMPLLLSVLGIDRGRKVIEEKPFKFLGGVLW